MQNPQKIYQSYQAFKALARWDRPIGIWLLLFPCLWSVALHSDDLVFLTGDVFFYLIGAILLRGAGCTLNDLMDHKYDAMVERTKNRPLPSGKISRAQAYGFLWLQLALGLLLFMSLEPFAQLLSLFAIILAAIYPLMKRYTYWPQAFLGLTFNFGILIAWADNTGSLNLTAFLLYAGAFFWTLGYDTIYAAQDMKDDIKIAVKSTALLWQGKLKRFVAFSYAAAAGCFAFAGQSLDFSMLSYLFLALPLSHFLWQVKNWQWKGPAENSLMIFRSNATFGLLFFLFLVSFHIFNG